MQIEGFKDGNPQDFFFNPVFHELLTMESQEGTSLTVEEFDLARRNKFIHPINLACLNPSVEALRWIDA